MRVLGVLLLVLSLAAGGLFVLATDARPSLRRTAQVSLDDLERGRRIVDSLGLRHMNDGEVRQLALPEADLDQAVNYLANRLAGGSASAQIALSQLIVRASLPLPGLHRFVNLELALEAGNDLLRPVQLRLGRLPLPAGLASDWLVRGLAHSAHAAELAAARSMLDSAQISGQTLALRFTWRGTAMASTLQVAMGHGVGEAMLTAYRARLSQLPTHDFAVLLGEAFALAQQRSVQFDPVIENRAALTVLAEMASGGRLLSRRGVLSKDRQSSLRLAGREDFAQHFGISAFITATGGEGLSDLAGLYKELKDAQGGSGFSFNDIAADRAGTRLAETSTRSVALAQMMQKRLAGVRDARVFFPKVSDLPEFMHQAEFQRRFGGVGQPAYQRMLKDIEARIAALPVYRE